MKNGQTIKDESNLRDLRILEEIEKDPSISQRDLSRHLGVALGITNSLIKTLARKGLVKIRGNNNRTLTYHLTHAGVLHKSKLAMQWTLNIVSDYRRLRREVALRLAALADRGVKKIGLYGANELAEIAILVAAESDVEIVGIADGLSDRGLIAGCRVGNIDDLVKLSPHAVINCKAFEINDDEFAILNDHRLTVYELIE